MIIKGKMKIRSWFLLSALMVSGMVSGQSVYDSLLKARALASAGRDDRAIGILTSVMKLQQDGRLYSERADASLEKGDLKNAISDYSNANNLIEYTGEYGMARAYALQGNASASLVHLERNLKSPLKKSEKEIMLDPAFGKIENTPEWRQFWKKDWFTGAEKGISEINYYLTAGKTEEALSSLSELESNYSNSSSAVYGRAMVNLAVGKANDAVKSVMELLKTEPDNVNYLYLLAKGQIESSDPAGASETYSKLIGMEVPDAELFIKRSECYRKTGEIDKAMADLTMYLTFYPENRSALSMAGKLEAASGDNLKAIEYFTNNLKLHPNDPQCYIDRANSYLAARSWEWAANDFGMSLDLDPGNPEVWLNKGIALANEGHTDDACHDFRQSMRLGNKRAPDYISKYCIK
jgi:tetratricopeptide (TPR) repeat protein